LDLRLGHACLASDRVHEVGLLHVEILREKTGILVLGPTTVKPFEIHHRWGGVRQVCDSGRRDSKALAALILGPPFALFDGGPVVWLRARLGKW
jgi:hypothetical protein